MRIGVTHSVELERGNVLVFDQLDDLIVEVFKVVRPRQRQLAVYGFETILFCMRDANIARLVISAPRRKPQPNRAMQAVGFFPDFAKTVAECRAKQPASGAIVPAIVQQERVQRHPASGNKFFIPFVHPPNDILLGVRGKEADVHPAVVVQIRLIRPRTHGIDKLVYAAAQLISFRESAEPGGKTDRCLRQNWRFQLHVEVRGGFISVSIHNRFVWQDEERVGHDWRAINRPVNVRCLRLLLRREEGHFRYVPRLPDGGDGVADAGVFSLHQIQFHRYVKIRMRKVDDYRIVLLFDALDFEISGVDFCFIR